MGALQQALLSSYPAPSSVAGAVDVLIHFDNGNGSSTFTEASSAKTITRTGTSILQSSTQVKSGFGASSVTGFANSTNRLTVPIGAIATGVDFTTAIWFYWDGTVAGNKAVFTLANNTELYLRNASSNALTLFIGGSNAIIGSVPSSGAWHLACIERVGSTVRLTMDGVSQGTVTYTTAMAAGTLTMGSYSDGTEYWGATSYLDDMYVRIGGALFGGTAFTPPSSPFTL